MKLWLQWGLLSVSSRLDRSSALSCSFWPFTILVAFLWIVPSIFISFLNSGAQNSTQGSRWGHTSIKQSKTIPSPIRHQKIQSMFFIFCSVIWSLNLQRIQSIPVSVEKLWEFSLWQSPRTLPLPPQQASLINQVPPQPLSGQSRQFSKTAVIKDHCIPPGEWIYRGKAFLLSQLSGGWPNERHHRAHYATWGSAIPSVCLTRGNLRFSHTTNPISSWDGCNFNSHLLLQIQTLEINIQKSEVLYQAGFSTSFCVSWNLCRRIFLYKNCVCVGGENHSAGKISDQSAFSLSSFSISFFCLLTHPHIATTACGGQHQPTGLTSRVLQGNINQQKLLCPWADIRNKLESLGMQQKRGKEHCRAWKIYHLQYAGSSATISAVCHLLSPTLPKPDEKYWFKELRFPWLFVLFLALQSFCLLVWDDLWCLLKISY